MLGYFSLTNLLNLIQSLLDVIVLWALVYYLLKIVKNNSRTIQIFKGVLLIICIYAFSSMVGLHTVSSLSETIMTWGVLGLIVIFQPEIRSLLEKVGKTNVFSRISTLTVNEKEHLVEELVKACAEMSKSKTGALISIEQGHSLSDYIKTGTSMDSVVSSELLCSIFQYGTPLHDGAVIIQGVKIACAAAYFPPTTKELPTSYGARHRAAVGISEITDSITIVVSEETGNISIAENGKLTVISEASLHEFLMNAVAHPKANEETEEVIEVEELQDGKRPGVFAHYFKGKNKKTRTKELKYAKKRKAEEHEEIVKTEIKDIEVNDLGVETLSLKEDTNLDTYFESIVEGEKEEKGIAEDSKLKSMKHTDEIALESEQSVEENITTLADDLLSDVIEPDAIILHYEKDEEPKKKKKARRKGRDS